MGIKIETQYAGVARVLVNGELVGLVEREGSRWACYNRRGARVFSGTFHTRAWAASALAASL